MWLLTITRVLYYSLLTDHPWKWGETQIPQRSVLCLIHRLISLLIEMHV